MKCKKCGEVIGEPIDWVVCGDCAKIANARTAAEQIERRSMKGWRSAFAPHPEVIMDRPSSISDISDGSLVRKLRLARINQRAQDQILMSEFGAWRGSVFWWEFHAEANIFSLLLMARTFHSAGLLDRYQAIIDYVRETYRGHPRGRHPTMPLGDEPPSYLGAQELSRRYSARPDVMSDQLRFEGGRMPGKKRKEGPCQIDIEDGEFE